MTIYGLFLKGESVYSWPHESYSKKLFYTKEAALKYGDQFVEKCCDPKLLDFLIKGTEEIFVIEYELEDKN